jgi:hypothetical protein
MAMGLITVDTVHTLVYMDRMLILFFSGEDGEEDTIGHTGTNKMNIKVIIYD